MMDKRLPTSVCDRPSSHDIQLNQPFPEQRNLNNFLYVLLNDDPKLILKLWIVDIVNCISISLSQSGPIQSK